MNRDVALAVAAHARSADDLRLLLDALGLLGDGRRHGSVTTYKKGRCRCDACRTAAVRSARRVDAAARERFLTDPEYAARMHGRAYTYRRLGCRCSPCRAAASAARGLERSRRAARERGAA